MIIFTSTIIYVIILTVTKYTAYEVNDIVISLQVLTTSSILSVRGDMIIIVYMYVTCTLEDD